MPEMKSALTIVLFPHVTICIKSFLLLVLSVLKLFINLSIAQTASNKSYFTLKEIKVIKCETCKRKKGIFKFATRDIVIMLQRIIALSSIK